MSEYNEKRVVSWGASNFTIATLNITSEVKNSELRSSKSNQFDSENIRTKDPHLLDGGDGKLKGISHGAPFVATYIIN